MSALDQFHTHLDTCFQCRNNPLGLCSVGYSLLELAGANSLSLAERVGGNADAEASAAGAAL